MEDESEESLETSIQQQMKPYFDEHLILASKGEIEPFLKAIGLFEIWNTEEEMNVIWETLSHHHNSNNEIDYQSAVDGFHELLNQDNTVSAVTAPEQFACRMTTYAKDQYQSKKRQDEKHETIENISSLGIVNLYHLKQLMLALNIPSRETIKVKEIKSAIQDKKNLGLTQDTIISFVLTFSSQQTDDLNSSLSNDSILVINRTGFAHAIYDIEAQLANEYEVLRCCANDLDYYDNDDLSDSYHEALTLPEVIDGIEDSTMQSVEYIQVLNDIKQSLANTKNHLMGNYGQMLQAACDSNEIDYSRKATVDNLHVEYEKTQRNFELFLKALHKFTKENNNKINELKTGVKQLYQDLAFSEDEYKKLLGKTKEMNGSEEISKLMEINRLLLEDIEKLKKDYGRSQNELASKSVQLEQMQIDYEDTVNELSAKVERLTKANTVLEKKYASTFDDVLNTIDSSKQGNDLSIITDLMSQLSPDEKEVAAELKHRMKKGGQEELLKMLIDSELSSKRLIEELKDFEEKMKAMHKEKRENDKEACDRANDIKMLKTSIAQLKKELWELQMKNNASLNLGRSSFANRNVVESINGISNTTGKKKEKKKKNVIFELPGKKTEKAKKMAMGLEKIQEVSEFKHEIKGEGKDFKDESIIKEKDNPIPMIETKTKTMNDERQMVIDSNDDNNMLNNDLGKKDKETEGDKEEKSLHKKSLSSSIDNEGNDNEGNDNEGNDNEDIDHDEDNDEDNEVMECNSHHNNSIPELPIEEDQPNEDQQTHTQSESMLTSSTKPMRTVKSQSQIPINLDDYTPSNRTSMIIKDTNIDSNLEDALDPSSKRQITKKVRTMTLATVLTRNNRPKSMLPNHFNQYNTEEKPQAKEDLSSLQIDVNEDDINKAITNTKLKLPLLLTPIMNEKKHHHQLSARGPMMKSHPFNEHEAIIEEDLEMPMPLSDKKPSDFNSSGKKSINRKSQGKKSVNRRNTTSSKTSENIDNPLSVSARIVSKKEIYKKDYLSLHELPFVIDKMKNINADISTCDLYSDYISIYTDVKNRLPSVIFITEKTIFILSREPSMRFNHDYQINSIESIVISGRDPNLLSIKFKGSNDLLFTTFHKAELCLFLKQYFTVENKLIIFKFTTASTMPEDRLILRNNQNFLLTDTHRYFINLPYLEMANKVGVLSKYNLSIFGNKFIEVLVVLSNIGLLYYDKRLDRQPTRIIPIIGSQIEILGPTADKSNVFKITLSNYKKESFIFAAETSEELLSWTQRFDEVKMEYDEKMRMLDTIKRKEVFVDFEESFCERNTQYNPNADLGNLVPGE